jgi:PAS domain S-box-containing protein
VHKDGSIVWVNLNVAPLWRPGEMPVHHIAIVQDITERKRAEEALRRSERQLRTVLDSLPVGVWFTDQSGRPVLSNPAAKKIWSGIQQIRIETAPNTVGWWETIGPSSELHRWALSHALTKGVPSLNETLDLECLDGTKKTIRNTTVPVQDEAGVVLGAIVLNEDITALRQAQEALKLTQFSVDHAVEGFFWMGHDARILNVNNAACRMLEYTRDELTTMTMHDIDPNLPLDLWSAYWKGLKQKGFTTFESKLWSKTGRVLDTEVTINYLCYEGKEYNCVIMRDIGERKKTEASLRQSEERYRSLVDNAPIGIFVNEGGRFAYVNQEMQRILKATNVYQLIGRPVLERIAHEFHTVVKGRIHELMGNGQPVPSLDEQYVRLDGSRVDVAVTAIPTSFDGTPVMQVLVLDITERKRMEEALRQRERDLRAAVEERERISQDLHDGILQSLFAMGLTLEAAKSMMSPRNRQTLSPSIDHVIDQLNRVMQEIRNFIAGLGSDLLKGKDLPTALQHMLKSLTQHHATRVHLTVEDRAAQTLSAEQALHLLLVSQEAISNCIRHGSAQEATVSLKMLKQGVRLSIRDNGSGFNTATAKGTGQGLHNMAARAQKIGGRLTVSSKINKGTRVVFDLPKEASSARR